MEKYSDQKRSGRISSNFDFSKNVPHIVHGWRPSSFARCTIVLLLQVNDKSAWRVMCGSPWHVRSANFAWAKRFCDFERPNSSVDVSFQQISWFCKCTNCTVQTLKQLNIVPQPMERAGVLHTPRYTSEDRWKSILDNFLLVLSSQISNFPRKCYTLFTADDLPILPGAP